MKQKVFFILAMAFIITQAEASVKKIYLLPEFQFEYDDSRFAVEYNNDVLNTIPNDVDVRLKEKKFYSTLAIRTGYVIRKNSARTTYSSSYSGDLEIEREIINVNGFDFVFSKYLREDCSSKGKNTSYQYRSRLDTIFDNFSYLTITLETRWDYGEELPMLRQNLLALLSAVNGFHIIDPAPMFAAHPCPNAETIQKEYEEEKVEFIKKLKKAVMRVAKNDTLSLVKIYNSAGNLLSFEWIAKQLQDKNFEYIADTVVSIREKNADLEMKTYMDVYRNYNYSFSREYQFYRRLARKEISSDSFLNTGLISSEVDTIQKFILLNGVALGWIEYNWRPPSFSRRRQLYYSEDYYWSQTNNFEPLLDEAEFHDYSEDFIRKIYNQELKTTNPDYYPYVWLTNQDSLRSYFLFNPEKLHHSEVLLASFKRLPDHHWTIAIDTLDPSFRYLGSYFMTTYGKYYCYSQQEKVCMFDTTYSPVKSIPLQFAPDTLSHFVFHCNYSFSNFDGKYIVPHDCEFRRDMVSPETMNAIWNKIVENKAYVTSLTHSAYPNYIDLDHGDTLIAPQVYYDYARSFLHPDEMAFRKGFRKLDLNKDGIEEFFQYSVSNGKVIDVVCYTLVKGELTEVEDSQATEWLKEDPDYLNFIYFTKIGRQKRATAAPVSR